MAVEIEIKVPTTKNVEVEEMIAVEEWIDFPYQVAEIVEETVPDKTCDCRKIEHTHKDKAGGSKQSKHIHTTTEVNIGKSCDA